MTAPFIEAFWEDCDALGLERPEIAPRATEHIAEMIEIISTLARKRSRIRIRRLDLLPHFGVSRLRQTFKNQI